MKLNPIILLAFLFSTKLIAQKSTFPAYYISIKGDTIKGSVVAFNGFEKSPATINFNDGKNQLVLTPENCRAVSLEGLDGYIAYKGKRAINATDLTSATVFDTTYRYEEVSIFLRIAFKSASYSLAVLKDNKRENFFLQKGEEPPVELLYRVNYINSALDEINTYKQQLSNILSAELQITPKLSERIYESRYTESSLISVMKKLAGKSKGTAAATNKGEFVMLPGISFSTLKITPQDNIDPFAQANYSNNVSASFGVGYNFYTRRRLASWFLSPQFRYYHTRHSGGARQPITNYQIDYILEGFSIFAGLFIGKEWISKPKLTWYTSFGPGFSNNIRYRRTQTITTNTTTSTKISDSENSIKPVFYFQTGVMFSKHFGVWSAIRFPSKLGNYGMFTTRSTSIQAGLEIRL